MRRRATLKLSSLWASLRGIPEKTKRIVVFAGLFVLSALITLAVLSSGSKIVERKTTDDFSVPRPDDSNIPTGDLLNVQDLILPMRVEEGRVEPYFLRPKLERWREEQVNRYWIPLEELALDLVRKENDRRIDTLFEEIP